MAASDWNNAEVRKIYPYIKQQLDKETMEVSFLHAALSKLFTYYIALLKIKMNEQKTYTFNIRPEYRQ